MKQLLILLLAVLAISCDGQKNTPNPQETGQEPANSIDTVCITCDGRPLSSGDSVPKPGKSVDIKKLIFRNQDGAYLLDPARYRTRAVFFSFLKTNSSIYDNNLIVYIARRDTTLFCYRQGIYNPDSKLPIMSASKAVTAAVIMSLVETGKLSLDDKVSQFIPSFNNEKKAITIRQLLTHTSGIVVDSPYDSRSNITLQQNIDSVALKTKLLFTPGSRAIYGSVGFSVASRVAEVIEKKSWAQIFQERIGSKCGMEQVVFSPDHPSNPATGYGIVCSMNEYLRFLTMIYNKGTFDGIRVLASSSIETMEADNTNNVDPTYGLGVFRSEIKNNTALEVACQSATGIHGWINREKNFYGLIFTQAGFDKTILTNLAFRKIVRDNL
jgi:hypothetical protein